MKDLIVPTMLAICGGLMLAGLIVGVTWWVRHRRAHGLIGYAPYFAGWFLTWPVISYMGGQGYSGLIGFLALPALLFVRTRRLPLYLLAFFAFMLWAIATSTWSPVGGPLMRGSLLDGDFALSATGMRIGLTGLAAALVLMAVESVKPGQAERSAALVRWTSIVQGIGVIVTALLMQQILTLLDPISDAEGDMPQNLMRNANSFLLLLPLVVAWAWHFRGHWGKIAVALAFPAIAYALIVTGTASAVLALAALSAACGLVFMLKKRGFAVLFGGIGTYILFAPWVVGAAVWLARTTGLPLPLSFWSRIHAWEDVSARVQEAPVLGHGLEATETWRDRFGDQPERLAQMIEDSGNVWIWEVYPIVPLHPHNMPLQIWAETGFIGALLSAAAFFCLAFRFRDTTAWTPIIRYGAAGLIGVTLTFCSLSYSLWNEAFWASVALAAAVIILQARQEADREPA